MSENVSAVVVLLVVASSLAIWGIVALRRSPFTPAQSLLYLLAVLLTRILWRAEIPRRLPVPEQSGAIVVCNHRSSVDPFFIQVAASRKVHWMVAKEYYQHPAFRWFLKTCEVIPAGRSGIDTAAIRMAIRLARKGELVGMLPEGRINVTRELMLPVRPGAVLVALKCRVPIIPCYIEGSPYRRTTWSPLFMPARVRVVFGDPLDFSEYYGREREPGVVAELMLQVLREIARLANQPEFEPRLAGRKWKPTEQQIENERKTGRAE